MLSLFFIFCTCLACGKECIYHSVVLVSFMSGRDVMSDMSCQGQTMRYNQFSMMEVWLALNLDHYQSYFKPKNKRMHDKYLHMTDIVLIHCKFKQQRHQGYPE